MRAMIQLADVEAARRRIASHIRRTPLLDAGPLSGGVAGSRLILKLENLQVTGSFKVRGATNKVLMLPPAQTARGLVTASGGNHGLGVAFAGRLAGAPVTIYLPANVPPAKAAKLERWGARVVRAGDVWDDANEAALAAARREGAEYVHPFADPAVIAGQGTSGLEILADAPQTELAVVAIGGGGLIAGVAVALKGRRPDLRIVGVEPVGAPTLHESLRAGAVIELPAVTTAANTLAPRRSHETNFEIIRKIYQRRGDKKGGEVRRKGGLPSRETAKGERDQEASRATGGDGGSSSLESPPVGPMRTSPACSLSKDRASASSPIRYHAEGGACVSLAPCGD